MSEIQTLVIDRSKWAVPRNLAVTGELSQLLSRTGLMCCLGFGCKAFNVYDRALAGKFMPDEVTDSVPGWMIGAMGTTELGGQLAELNDATNITDAERERRIANLWPGPVEFVGEYLGPALVEEQS